MKKCIMICLLFLSLTVHAASQGEIASYMKDAPEIKDHEDLEKVVDYLKKKYREDEDKARAILAWIVFNIDYDEYVSERIEEDRQTRRDLSGRIPEKGDIIKTRLGVCEDIANLYAEMAQMADMDARVISGCYAAKYDKRRCHENPHSWNAIWIDRQWELVDPTFAMKGGGAMRDVSTQRQYERQVKRREKYNRETYKVRQNRGIDLRWFMVDPGVMEKDHQPDDKRWYLTRYQDRRNRE